MDTQRERVEQIKAEILHRLETIKIPAEIKPKGRPVSSYIDRFALIDDIALKEQESINQTSTPSKPEESQPREGAGSQLELFSSPSGTHHGG